MKIEGSREFIFVIDEIQKLVGWSKFGDYPGVALLIKDPDRWSNYIKDSIIEATINKDILLDM